MDGPFFGTHFNQQRKPSPKVVSIPVHFVGSAETPKTPEKTRPEAAAAALKVQKVFRGFLVRKSVKKIASIRDQVREIERRIMNSESIDLIVRDPKERLRINETLMNLLFRLDSIRGVDSGVRDFRKAVIKKAIALQEKVDAIVAAGYQTLDRSNSECLIHSENQTLESQSITLEARDIDSNIAPSGCNDDASEQIEEAGFVHDCGEKETNEFEQDSGAEADEECCIVKEIDENCDVVKAMSECGEESAETSRAEDCSEYSGSSPVLIEEGEKENGSDEKIRAAMEEDGDGKRNRELLEKMMVDNEKMMSLMTQIFERNEMQMRMLNSLNNRVEQLEKAFICDKLRRKKKKHT